MDLTVTELWEIIHEVGMEAERILGLVAGKDTPVSKAYLEGKLDAMKEIKARWDVRYVQVMGLHSYVQAQAPYTLACSRCGHYLEGEDGFALAREALAEGWDTGQAQVPGRGGVYCSHCLGRKEEDEGGRSDV